MKKYERKGNIIVFRPAYPNAKDARYYWDKAVDTVLAVVTGVGAVSAMLFLFTL